MITRGRAQSQPDSNMHWKGFQLKKDPPQHVIREMHRFVISVAPFGHLMHHKITFNPEIVGFDPRNGTRFYSFNLQKMTETAEEGDPVAIFSLDEKENYALFAVDPTTGRQIGIIALGQLRDFALH